MSEKIHIPVFAKEQLLKQKCILCHTQLKLSSVIACGIKLHKDGQTYFYYETQCKTCKNQTYTIFTSKPMDMPSFLEEMNKISIVSTTNNVVEKSKISDYEFETIKIKLKESKSDSEILFHIGLTEELMEKYCKENQNEDK